MKKIISAVFIVFISLFAFSQALYSGEYTVDGDAEWMMDFYYEYNRVDFNSLSGNWQEQSATLSYIAGPCFTPYIELARLTRLGTTDYNIKAGGYYRLPEGSLWVEVGAGADVDFTYNFSGIIEYESYLAEDINWLLNTTFLDYDAGSVLILKPGLIRYLGDNHFQLSYMAIFTQGRGYAQGADARAYFAVSENAGLLLGASLGQRLFDLNPEIKDRPWGLNSFAGLRYNPGENLTIRAGYTYGVEEPDFRLHGPNLSLAIRF